MTPPLPKPPLSPAEFAYFMLGLKLYPWQLEMVEASRHYHARTALVAANGSGKTACVNVVLLLWFLWAYPRGIAMVTSGSWKQLRTQLWPNLEMYRQTFPTWTWNSERISTPEKGFIEAYSTTDPGKAEGHHEHLPERPVMLMVDEAKSVPETIFQALSRCTPTFFILTSSPGAPSGAFYRAFHGNEAKLYHSVRATAFDCPHIQKWKIELAQATYGPNYEKDPIYRSMILAEFTEGEDAMLIPKATLLQALEHPPEKRDGVTYAAVDWAAGGDETVMAVRRGNSLRILYKNRERDTTLAAKKIVQVCRNLGITQGKSFGDVCGIGLAIMQAAEKMHGWRFREFNGGSPVEDEHYVNLNAQAWYYFRQCLEQGQIHFENGLDEETIEQLTDRLVLWDKRGRIQCEPKDKMKERGVSSPDRADALIMAWWAGRHMSYADRPPAKMPKAAYTAPKHTYVPPNICF